MTNLSQELKSLQPRTLDTLPAADLEVSLIIPAKSISHALIPTVKEAYEFLRQRYGDSFEIILVPNPQAGDSDDTSVGVSESLAAQYKEVRVCPHYSPPGKGAAIRTGFFQSRGRKIF